jgi:hypothetical protein
MLDRLQELLERQLALVHQGRLDAAIGLCDQTDQCVRQIAEARASDAPRSTDQWVHVERLYRDLCLALTVQRTEVSAALNAVRQGRRVLNTYSRTGPFRR